MTSRFAVIVAVVGTLLLGGCAGRTSQPTDEPQGRAVGAVPSASPVEATPPPIQPHGHGHDHAPSTLEFPSGIVPVRISIPAIGVDAALEELGMVSTEEMETPENFDNAGWWTLGRLPGEIGPAVIAGHVDSKAGPAVFHRLPELAPGDEVVIHGEDGESRTFVVEATGQYPKDRLPDEVFGFSSPRPELRLITCGGDFDSSIGHYTDNVVVYAQAQEEQS